MALALLFVTYQTDSAPTTTVQQSQKETLEERGFDVSKIETAIEDAVEKAMLSATDGTHDQKDRGSNDIRQRWNIHVTLNKEDDKSEEQERKNEEDVVGEHRGTGDVVLEVQDDLVPAMNTSRETETITTPQTGCQDVNDEELEEPLRRIRQEDYALIHFPQFINPVGNAQKLNNYQQAKNNTCPVLTPEQKSTGEVRVTSLCPWDWFQNKDESRYPRIMMFAQCECVQCRKLDGTCEVAWYNVRVLRRSGTCVNGKYVYEPALEPVPVACTCDPAVRVNVSVVSKERPTEAPNPEETDHQRSTEILDVIFRENIEERVEDDVTGDDDDDVDVGSVEVTRHRRAHHRSRRRHHDGRDRLDSFYIY